MNKKVLSKLRLQELGFTQSDFINKNDQKYIVGGYGDDGYDSDEDEPCCVTCSWEEVLYIMQSVFRWSYTKKDCGTKSSNCRGQTPFGIPEGNFVTHIVYDVYCDYTYSD